MRVQGLDISHWQGAVDWQKVKAAGLAFAFIKATEGDSHTDSRFAANWQGAQEAGLRCGAYHFFAPSLDPVAQAQHFCQTVNLDADSLPPVLDLEKATDLDNAALIGRVKAWLDQVQRSTGHKPMIYTGSYYWNPHMTDRSGQPPAWTRDYYLWIAHYSVDQPTLPLGWQTWSFWQYTDQGSVDGIYGNVDLNWFNGSVEELAGLQSAQPDATRTYNVQADDTLASVAALHGVSLAKLAEANPQLLQSGMELQVPVSASPIYYTVRTSDSLGLIAWRFGVSQTILAEANDIQDANQIWVGQRLRIP